MFWTPAKSTDTAALQACFDALSVFDTDAESVGVGVVSPTLLANGFFAFRRDGKTMTT